MTIAYPWIEYLLDKRINHTHKTYKTHYRGQVLLCTPVNYTKIDKEDMELANELYGLPVISKEDIIRGHIIGIGELFDIELNLDKNKPLERMGYYLWKFKNVNRIKPVIYSGRPGLIQADMKTVARCYENFS